MDDRAVFFASELREIYGNPTAPRAIGPPAELLLNPALVLGVKAAGLLRLPVPWTVVDFAVITSNACRRFLGSEVETPITEAAMLVLERIRPSASLARIIVRSSAANESLRTRGRYRSIVAEPQVRPVVDAIKEVLQSFADESRSQPSDAHFSILIHEFLPCSLSGHLSNERRVGPRRHFLGEYSNELEPAMVQTFTLQSKKGVLEPPTDHYIAADERPTQSLRCLARWVHQHIGRAHLEWIVSSHRLVIVQCDVEGEANVAPPLSLWKAESVHFAQAHLQAFRVADRSTTADLRKSSSILTFQDCSLPTAPLYLLRERSDMEAIIGGKLPTAVEADLKHLLSYPVVIRIDVVAVGNEDWENLPASSPLRTLDAASAFLLDAIPTACQRVRASPDLAVVLHHFIPARAAAWAEAVPGSDRVRIDAIWGHPDGLQSFPCDSIYISLREGRQDVFRRFKDEFLDVDEEGRTYRRLNGPPWDMEPVLQDADSEEIARKTMEICVHKGEPVRVMWFVGTDARANMPRCFPWIVVTDFVATADPLLLRGDDEELIAPKADRMMQVRRLALGRVRRLQDHADLSEFDKAPEKFDLGGHRVVVRPVADLIRSKEFLRSVADAVSRHRWRLVLEGSPLGHAFYQLRLLGVDVESAMEYLLEPKRRKFHRKLVRDLIPTSIRAQGEKVDFRQLRGRELTAALLRKLVEEALEVRAASSRTALREELADIYEVLSALARNSGITPEEIASLADRKRTEKGGFEVGYELVATGGAGATTPGEYRKSLHIRGKSEGQRATIPIPLVPPPEGAGRDQLRITIGDVSIRVSLVYKGDHVEVRLDSDREVVDDRQLELFDK